MMINTSNFSKCLIIFLVYDIMIIFTVLCIDSDTDDTENKIVPDFGIIRITDKNDYFEYYFRRTEYMGQPKVLPKTFFKSVYNCSYLILPELNEDKDYDAYKKKMKGIDTIFKSIYDKYNADYTKIKEQEDHLVQEFEKTYTATKKAYDEVMKYEKLTSFEQNDSSKQDKEDAINNYLENQMPEISEETFPNAYWNEDIRYIYKNYEVHAHPTDEVYYRSNILQEEYNAVMDGNTVKTCNVMLTKEEYDEVLFLYELLHETMYNQSELASFKVELFFRLQNSLPKLKIYYTKDELKQSENDENNDYTSTSSKLQSEFVVNHENYMSYLVRMKILGKIGFHSDYHKYMFKTRPDYYAPDLSYADTMNQNSLTLTRNGSGKLQKVIQPYKGGKRTVDMDIHATSEQQTYAKLIPFDPKDI